jgi:hypothetical protein
MLRKSIATLTAILMIAAIATVSVFAAVTDPHIFYKIVDNAYVYAGDRSQHMIDSISNDDGDVEIVFDFGTEEASNGYLYDGAVTAVTPVGTAPDGFNYDAATQTLTYEQESTTEYNQFTFTIVLTPNAANPDAPPLYHPALTYYVNVPLD